MNLNKLGIISLILIIGGVIFNNPFSTVTYGAGVIAPNEPLQKSTDTAPFYYNDIEVKPQASFVIEAKVLAKKQYYFDAGSHIAPVDLALGWGRMSDETILKDIDISQRHRFFFWRVDEFPIPRKEIEQHSTNMHIIPSNETITQQINAIKEGQLIRLKGYLVNLKRADGWHWESSLSRRDTGGGACELMWVEAVENVSL
ncbi:MAG: hypothetical protein KAI02_01270 [Gammaproteobacteria bacterium]|nr:hypothetical protein [Gammaproteobacteria bacterium]